MNRSAVPPPVTQVMDEAEAWLPALMAAVEERLAELVEGLRRRARRRRARDAPGRRQAPAPDARPAVRRARRRAPALRGAAAIELVHMATLVHDDVLDQAPLRRGLPTVVATSGRERATAVGDLLLSRAFAELGEGDGAGGERQVELLAGASVGLALGELAQRRDAWEITTSAERYLERCLLKTARLFECACLIGRVSGSGDPAAEALRSFGQEIGLAFQLLDDVLDVAGPPERTGKARGTDLLDGTVTLPLILARERDPALAELDLRSLDAAGAEAVCDRIAATRRPGRGPRRRPRPSRRGEANDRGRAGPCRTRSAGCSRWSPTAWSSATPECKGGQTPLTCASALEVFGEDPVLRQRFCEPVDLALHVRARQELEVVENRLRRRRRERHRSGQRPPGRRRRRAATRTRGSGV